MRRRLLVLLAVLLPFGAAADSLFSADAEENGTLISLPKARYEEGDLITVLVRETIEAQTQSNTDARKESDIESDAPAGDNPFLTQNQPNGLGVINPGELPIYLIEAEKEHRTQGRTQRQNTLVTTIACRVVEVLPKGNLRITGTKKVTVNREDTLIEVTGIIRAEDVSAANTILSTQLAEASVSLQGKGPLWNNQRRGILTRFLDWFSPF